MTIFKSLDFPPYLTNQLSLGSFSTSAYFEAAIDIISFPRLSPSDNGFSPRVPVNR